MNKRAILIVQTHLKGLGHFPGNPDGLSSPATDAAVMLGLTPRQAGLPAGALAFEPRRRLTMMFQLIAKDRGIDCDPVDGFWGPVTQNAFDAVVHLLDRGTLPPNWRDDPPSDANPHVWPRDRGDQSEMRAFYGPPGAPPIKRVRVPWKLRLAWDKSQVVTHIGCHSKVAGSVEDVLTRVHAHYGEAELRRLRLDLYGGCFMARRKRGGSSWSNSCLGRGARLGPRAERAEMGPRPGRAGPYGLQFLVACMGGRGLGQPRPVAQFRLDACAGGAVVGTPLPVHCRSCGPFPPGIKPKAPGERLPVPAGWRFCGGALSLDGEALGTIKRIVQP